MEKTGSVGNQKTWTFSFWAKRAALGNPNVFFGVGDARLTCRFDPDVIQVYDYSPQYGITTNAVFKDVSAWYNIVFNWDTTQAVASNRIKLWVNGEQITSFSASSYPSENYDSIVNSTVDHQIGGRDNFSSERFNGYMAEAVLIDGSALTASSFGEFNEDSPTIWQPIDVSGLTFGTNGFYCDFEASDNLGNDANGGTDLGETNLAATDQATDTPTNNGTTLNPLVLIGNTGTTYTEGNLSFAASSSNWTSTYSTIAASQGKWYAEMKIETLSSSTGYGNVGIIDTEHDTDANFIAGAKSAGLELDYRGGANVNAFSAGSSVEAAGVDFAEGAIVGLAVDMDNNALYISENGTYITISSAVGDPTSGASKTGAVTIPSTFNFFAFAIGSYTANFKGSWNFGSPSYSISSGNADADGYGNFEYAVPSGYYALNTKNLGAYGG